jgi:uncharacterized membrane protein YhaH (DUF805 family)
MNWYFRALRKYAVFAGRASRKEFWTFGLVHLAIIFGLTGINAAAIRFGLNFHIGQVRLTYEFAVLMPSIAVTVRRLHDTNRKGWWYLIVFVPLLGIIGLLVMAAEGSQPGENRFGPNPKAGVCIPGRMAQSSP